MGLFRRGGGPRARRSGRRGSADGHGTGEAAGSGDLPDPRTAFPRQPVPDDPAAAAAEFWRYWHDVLPDVSAALGNGCPSQAETLLASAVARLHPDLHFSVDRGGRAIYALVLSGQEDPALRPYTDAWLAGAPSDDAMWEYHDSVPPVPDPAEVTVHVGGHRVGLADVRVVARVDEAEGVVDVAVYHPALAGLDEASRRAMTFLPLDAALGERLAAERLRRVETALGEPDGTVDLTRLRVLVEELADTVGGAH